MSYFKDGKNCETTKNPNDIIIEKGREERNYYVNMLLLLEVVPSQVNKAKTLSGKLEHVDLAG